VGLYLTPARFRTSYYGSSLLDPVTGKPLLDLQLASVLQQASSVAEGYVAASQMPVPHNFLGGSIVDERHRWAYPMTPFELGQRRVYPYHTPLKALTKFRIYVTNTQYVGIGPSDVVYQPTERYLEVVSLALTSAGLFNALIIPNVGLAQPFVVLDYTYGYEYPMTDEACFATDSGGLTFQAPDQFWDAAIVPTFKVAGSPATPASHDSTEGTVTFASPPAGTVTASYTATMPRGLGGAVGAIAAFNIGEAILRAKGMSGVSRLTVAEVTIARMPLVHGSANQFNLSELVPEAAFYLDGLKLGRASI
jgi:hypothetical protein